VDFLEGAFQILPPQNAALSADQGYVRLAENPAGVKWLFAPTGAAIHHIIGAARGENSRPLFAVATRSGFLSALKQEPLKSAGRAAPYCAERADPSLCARRALGRRSLAVVLAANAILLVSLFAPERTLALLASLPLAALFLTSVFLRLFACAASFERNEPILQIDDARLPVYTLIIPLYREAKVARQLARALDRLDYPGIMAQTPPRR